MRQFLPVVIIASAFASATLGQVTVPNECESASSKLLPLSAYFGGVASFGTEIVSPPSALYSGSALRAWANFRRDNFFRLAGFTIGVNLIAPPSLAVPPDASFFAFALDVPDLTGKRLLLRVVLREDDDGDGIIDPVETDDEWESSQVLTGPGRVMVNMPLTSFVDANPLVGNDTRQFTSTPRMGINISFETRQDLPGGIIEFPVSLLVDHVGFFPSAQSLPTPCVGDFDRSGAVNAADIFEFINAWFLGEPRADVNASGLVDAADIFSFLNAWFAGCP